MAMLLFRDLQRLLRDRPDRVVFVVGTGVALGAVRATDSEPFASWEGLIRSGLERAHMLGKLSDDELDTYRRQLKHTVPNALVHVASVVEQALGAPENGEFRRWLRETVGSFEKNLGDSSVLDALAEHQRRGALLVTTNYDLLLEHVTGLPTVTWRDPANVDRLLREPDDAQILHLHGVWRWPDSVVLGIRSYEDIIRDSHARAVLTTLRTDRTLVFVGCGAGLRDPNLGAFLKWTGAVFASSEARHFRLCRDAEEAAVRAEHPDDQRILPLRYGPDHADLPLFLLSLLSSVSSSPHPAPPAPQPTPAPALAGAAVDRRPAAPAVANDVHVTAVAQTPPYRRRLMLQAAGTLMAGLMAVSLYVMLAGGGKDDTAGGAASGKDAPPPRVAANTVALMKTQHVEAAALLALLAPIVPENAGRLELGSEGLVLAGPAADEWKEPLDHLVQSIDLQRRELGELARVSTPDGVWATYELGVEGFERRAAAIAGLDEVERTEAAPTLGVVAVRGPFKAQEGVARWLRASGEATQFKEWCYNNPSLKKTECAKTLRDCEFNAISWEEGAEAAEAVTRGRPKRKYCHGKLEASP